MGNKKGRVSKPVRLIIISSMVMLMLLGVFNITYALQVQGKPDVVVQIDADGSITQSGNLYSGIMWYPGLTQSGIVRVENSFRRIKLSDLSLDVYINNVHKESPVYASFMKNMNMTIYRGRLLVFNDVLTEARSFSELAGGSLQLDEGREFYLEKGEAIDLKYDLCMDPNSGNELENLSARVDFHVIMDEATGLTDDSDGNQMGE